MFLLTRRTVVAFSLFLALAVTAVDAGAAEAKAKKTAGEVDDAKQIAASTNEFGFDLYGRLADSPGNLFFSPASISTALAMTYAGAEGETETQMAKALHLDGNGRPLPQDRVHQGFGALAGLLHSDGGKNVYELTMANRLWGQKTFPFQPGFLQTTRQNYGAELAEIDFANAEQARQRINAWVEEQTNGKIQNLIPPQTLDSATRLVLTNAIYFKGTWNSQFSEDATKEAPFHVTHSEQVEAPMMHQTDRFRYADAENLQLLKMSYAGDHLSMLVLLPKERDGIADLEKNLTVENLQRWTGNLRMKEVAVALPRFKLTSQFQLADALRTLGMTLPFSNQADLSGISTAEELTLSEVIHKAFVDVNEEGTEAAAATAAVVAITAAPAEEPVVFRADHPFVFLIQDDRTGVVLFMGRVANPQP